MEIEMDLYKDWLNTVREIFRGSDIPLPEHWDDAQIGKAYYMQTSSSEQMAEERRDANEARIRHLQQTLLENMEQIVLPDIRSRTGYSGNRLRFRWVYAQGEHIVEEYSQYRIPLGPSPD
ncbi:hypothetical protein [Paenibacillus senegalensis]|uniref:hypothetical protein n=1 Tax=Paenibacillus senegalensis TaxID=1465766 RepID=UPI000289FD56|nr:hypothetical protein [Paenibacillus senegalensis]